jgi:vacuolar-type H+-ATPase subunit I/STV1
MEQSAVSCAGMKGWQSHVTRWNLRSLRHLINKLEASQNHDLIKKIRTCEDVVYKDLSSSEDREWDIYNDKIKQMNTIHSQRYHEETKQISSQISELEREIKEKKQLVSNLKNQSEDILVKHHNECDIEIKRLHSEYDTAIDNVRKSARELLKLKVEDIIGYKL